MQKKTRAPGGGRKPRGDFRGNSKILTVRVTPATRTALEGLAKRHDRSLSQEMHHAFDDWIRNHRRHKRHIGALMHAIALVAENIEERTGRRWQEDAYTGEQLRVGVEKLIFHFAPMPDGPAPIPPKVEEATTRFLIAKRTGAPLPSMRGVHLPELGLGETEAGTIITLIENAPASDKPPLGLRLLDQRDPYGFWQFLRDLGSGWQRNRDKLMKEPHK
jgi:hypothetical protein